jgi:hypothetical protein
MLRLIGCLGYVASRENLTVGVDDASYGITADAQARLDSESLHLLVNRCRDDNFSDAR